MRVNVDKVLERDSKISELDGRAGNNHITTSCFRWILSQETTVRSLVCLKIYILLLFPVKIHIFIRSFCSFWSRCLHECFYE